MGRKLDLVYVVMEYTGQGEDLIGIYKYPEHADKCAAIDDGRSVRVEEVEEDWDDD